MRVPVSWLGEFVDLPESITPDDLHAALVRVGFEEEDLHTFELVGPIVVGQVVDFVDEPQSNGKTIRWCHVDVGESEPRGIVCGAHNFFVGDKVVVTLPGSVLPGPFPIAARQTYGHVSDGMIASARELGLGDEHDGILRLAELGLDPKIGADAISLLSLDDWAVEVNVTPDRGYALSIRGIAREFSLSTGAVFRDPGLPKSGMRTADASSSGPVPVSLDDRVPIRGNQGCSLFVTRIVRGVDTTRHTPAWMISRLKLAGIRSISLAVDISNYVMVELGQPLHAYDLDKIRGGIVVRRAAKGENLTTLDSQVRVLDPEDLLIADDDGPIGMAGVMGGERTENSDGTVNILVEAANFDPISIARSARRHRLPSEASRRFERGVDPAVAEVAAARAVELLVDLAGGTADGEVWRVGGVGPAAVIGLPAGYVNSIVGADFTEAETMGAIEAIGASIEPTSAGYRVVPPTWRPDLRDQADLAEEVARIVGFDRIPSVLPVAPPGRGLTRPQRLRRSVAMVLAANGATEVMAYPFLSVEQRDMFGAGIPAIKLANPLDGAAPYLRTSMLPGLITIAQRNLSRGLVDLKLFEVGVVFLLDADADARTEEAALPRGDARPTEEVLAALNEMIPAQPVHAAALFLGDAVRKQPGQPVVSAGFADALSAAKQVALAVGAPLRVQSMTQEGLHPGRTAGLYVGSELVGYAGELLPALAVECNLPARVAVMELDVDRLIALAPTEISTDPIATFPAATQDLSLVVPEAVAAAEVLAAVIDGAGELLEHAEIVDDYRGHGVQEGSKSLTFALRFRSADKTLTAAEATAAKLAGVASAAEKFGAVLRE